MAKDPAFLFYSSDFISGVSFLSNEQTGIYIKLLCLQHQTGRLKEKDMIKICGTYDEDVFAKFKKDENGFYYNQRLEDECGKRKSYSDSRRKNRASKKPLKQTHDEDMTDISKTYVPHMENEIENEDVNTIKKEDEKKAKPKICLFRNSEYYDYEKFETKFAGTDYEKFNIRFYYESVLNWSNSNNKSRTDWIATARNFMLGSVQDGKAIYKDTILKNNGRQQTTNNGKQPTGKDVDIQSGLDELAAMYRPANK